MIRKYHLLVILIICGVCWNPGFLMAQENPLVALFRAAVHAYEQHDYPLAIRLFEKAIQLNPQNPAAYNFAALAYKQNGDSVDKVETILKHAIRVDPDYAPAYENLSKIYYGTGRFEEAEHYALGALDRDPDQLNALQTLGWIYLVGIRRPASAVEYFDRAISIQRIPHAMFGLGLAYIMNDQRLYALEMITSLRGMNEEGLAQELQKMVETKNVEGALVALSPIKIDQPALLTIDQHHYEVPQEMPVRLRDPDSGRNKPTGSPVAGQGDLPSTMTPAERLRQLRQQSQPY
jgi:tetratricopeptide (TPR) repeat protein